MNIIFTSTSVAEKLQKTSLHLNVSKRGMIFPLQWWPRVTVELLAVAGSSSSTSIVISLPFVAASCSLTDPSRSGGTTKQASVAVGLPRNQMSHANALYTLQVNHDVPCKWIPSLVNVNLQAFNCNLVLARSAFRTHSYWDKHQDHQGLKGPECTRIF